MDEYLAYRFLCGIRGVLFDIESVSATKFILISLAPLVGAVLLFILMVIDVCLVVLRPSM